MSWSRLPSAGTYCISKGGPTSLLFETTLDLDPHCRIMAVMRYDEYNYLWPPRPENALPTSSLQFYEKRGWVAQMKMNGTCTVVFVSPDGELIFKTRHNEDHKNWVPSDESTKVFRDLPGDGWYVFVCELLHNKTSLVKDTFYIFDILVNDGELLVGSTFTDRISLLQTIFDVKDEENVVSLGSDGYYILNSNAWLAKTITADFKAVWRVADNNKPEDGAPLVEGLVLKNPKAVLDVPGRRTDNSDWQVKCRVSHKNYVF